MSETTPPAGGCAGCTIVVVLVALIGCVVWIGLTTLLQGAAPRQAVIAPIVVDDARLLSPEAVGAIEQVRFPPDVAVVVRTVDSLDAAAPGPAATDLMEGEPHWQTVRPRTWQQRYIRRDAPWSNGIYMLVARDPALLQVRFGEQIRLEAYRHGLGAGPQYRKWQESFSVATADQQIPAHLQAIARELPTALNLPWYLRYTKGLAASAFSEIEDLVLPSEGAFRQLALRNYTRLLRSLNAATSGWRFIAVSAAIYVMLWIVGTVGLHVAVKRHNLVAVFAGLMVWVLTAISYFIGAIGSLVLLSSGRFEDELLLKNLGLQQFATTGLSITDFSASGGFVLAITAGVIAFIRAFVGDLDEALEANARGEVVIGFSFITAPFAWAALVLFLPRALGVLGIFHLVATGLSSLISLARKSNMADGGASGRVR